MKPAHEVDFFDIPAFLRITPETEARRRQAWIDNPPKPFVVPGSNKHELSPEAQRIAAEIEAERKQRQEQRRMAKDSRNNDAAPVDLIGMRWNTQRSRWERDPFVNDELLAKLKADNARKVGLVYNDKVVPIAKSERIGAKPAKTVAKDDLGGQVSAHCGADVVKLKAFAAANGVWDDKYAKLPNPGLIRMNVCNRLRAKVRKGHKVEWV